MKFIAPVPLLQDYEGDTDWITFDCSQYIPITATLVLLEIIGDTAGITEANNNIRDKESIVMAKASGDTNLARQYKVFGVSTRTDADRIHLGKQVLAPVGTNQSIDLRVPSPGFVYGLSVNVIGYLEESPYTGTEVVS